MVSKNKLKQYLQLHSKKFRQKYGLFIVEGLKSVIELLDSGWEVEAIVCKDDQLRHHISDFEGPILTSSKEYSKLSSQKSPFGILAIVAMREPEVQKGKWVIALDQINDPGNLGTILRIADWYGLEEVVCSADSVDHFNPKCIQASMGSFLRIKVSYCNLNDYLRDRPVYAAVLNAQNFRSIVPKKEGVILIGNEAHGIRESLLQNIEHKAISIPRNGKAESLNAAVATAVVCERFLN